MLGKGSRIQPASPAGSRTPSLRWRRLVFLLIAVSAKCLAQIGGPPGIITQPKSQTVIQGTNVTFSVVVSSVSYPTYQWRFAREARNNIPGATNSSYTVTNAQATNAGDYSVAVTNAVGYTNSAVAQLTVRVPPLITRQPQGTNVTIGSPVTFDVGVEGSPTLRFQWRFNGADIFGATTQGYTNSNVHAADGGDYSVVITNGVGATNSIDAHLTVTVPALRLTSPQRLATGSFQFYVSGVSNQPYVVEGSDNLTNWTPLNTNALSNGTSLFVHTQATAFDHRYYRAKSQ